MSEQAQEPQNTNPLPETPVQPTTTKTGGTGRRARKFPLTLHPTGQYCKKICGKMYYFGRDKQQALQLYYQQSSSLHAGQGRSAALEAGLTLKALCNLYLDYQNKQLAAGEIKYAHFYDLQRYLGAFLQQAGPNRLVSDIRTVDIQQFRAKLIADGLAPNTINPRLQAVKAVFNWALDNEVIDRGPNLRAVKGLKKRKVKRQTFTRDEIRRLYGLANTQMKAMILLGLNCGFGCTDCGELRWDHLNLDEGQVHYPRGKTGVARNMALWPETVEAIKTVPRRGELVFYTKYGNPWVQQTTPGKNPDRALSKEFSKLMRKANIATEKGTGFYTLRRTAATIAGNTGDVFAVQGILGHADTKMASTYVQDITPQTNRAIQHTREWFNQKVPNTEGSSPE